VEDPKDILRQTPVIPVLTVGSVEQAVPLARALVEGGVTVLEITLRTPAGLPSIKEISKAVPEAIVGAGTVRNPADFMAACEAGSRFIVSPGITDSLLQAAKSSLVPLIPGVGTVSEMMWALDYGIDCLKFFPAGALGGADALKAFSGPFPEVSFCPTGGVGLHNIDQYYALPSVLTVGGSWLTPQALLEAGDWSAVTALAHETASRVSSIKSKR